MTKRSLFAALAALCAFSAFCIFSCSHALEEQSALPFFQQSASVSLQLSGMTVSGVSNTSVRTADDAVASEYPKLTITLLGDGINQTQSQSVHLGRTQYSAVFMNLPVGAQVMISAEYWNHDMVLEQRGYATTILQAGANSVGLDMKPVEQDTPAEDVYRLKVIVDNIERPQNTEIAVGNDSVSLIAELLKNEQSVPALFKLSRDGVDVETNTTGSFTVSNLVQNQAVDLSIVATDAAIRDKTVAFNLKVRYTPAPLPGMAGEVTAKKPGDLPLTAGDQTTNVMTWDTATVTFNYSGDVTDAVIHLSGLPVNGYTVNTGTDNGDGTVTGGASENVVVTFNASSVSSSPHIITAYATSGSRSGQSENRVYSITVDNLPQLNGTFSATAGGTTISNSGLTLPKGVQVKFDFSETNPTSGSGTPTLDLSVSKTGAAIQPSDITVAAGDGTYDNGTVRGTHNSVTLTFNGTGRYSVTPTAKKSGWQDQRGTNATVAFTVADFTARVRSGSADLAQSDGNTNFTLETGAQSLTVSLYTGSGTLYSGGGVSNWSVSATDSANTMMTITPTSGANAHPCSFNFPNNATDLYTLSVQAAVYGTTVGPYQFTVMKVTDAPMQRTITINKPVTIAPTSNITISAPASAYDALFTIASGGSLTLGGNVIVRAPHGLGAVIVNTGGTLTLTGNAGIAYDGGSEATMALVTVDGGEFTMDGGKISNNRADNISGGGVRVTSGRFTMSGGTISGNTAKEGGGVYMSGNATFTMSGGTISSNTVTESGGGVYVNNNLGGRSASFTMSGTAVISGNRATISGGGVFVYNSSSLGGTFTNNGRVSGNNAPTDPDVHE